MVTVVGRPKVARGYAALMALMAVVVIARGTMFAGLYSRGDGVFLVLSQPNCWQDRDGEA